MASHLLVKVRALRSYLLGHRIRPVGPHILAWGYRLEEEVAELDYTLRARVVVLVLPWALGRRGFGGYSWWY